MPSEGRMLPLSLAGFLPGVGITGALGWECPVDLRGYQIIFTKGRRILKKDPGGTEPAQ
jgi:hypothetical protein